MKRLRTSNAAGGTIVAVLLGIASIAPTEAQNRAPLVPLAVDDDPTSGTLTVRLGPVLLPSGSGHGVIGPRDVYLSIPFDGWLVAFRPRIVDAAGSPKVDPLLHHVSFWNTARPDFLCPNKQEYVFGSGGEMNEWPRQGDLGYPITVGDSIRIETRFHNPTGDDHLDTYLEVDIEYVVEGAAGAPRTNAYPAKFNVDACLPSGYLLRPGETAKAAGFRIPFAGTLRAIGGHLHDYGQALWLKDETRGREVARLRPELDREGRLIRMPIVWLPPGEGYRLEAGDSLTVTADYRVTMEQLPALAMGILIGQFVPDDERELAALRTP